RADPKLESEQVGGLRAFRKARNAKAVDRALRELERAAGSKANLMPAILSAVRGNVTLGEISDVLRSSFGTYRERQEV
ncbi:MAG: methylmalonyl-CoA mutase, partial [Methanobacteriota archaeon]